MKYRSQLNRPNLTLGEWAPSFSPPRKDRFRGELKEDSRLIRKGGNMGGSYCFFTLGTSRFFCFLCRCASAVLLREDIFFFGFVFLKPCR